jgi:hypothetical protein
MVPACFVKPSFSTCTGCQTARLHISACSLKSFPSVHSPILLSSRLLPNKGHEVTGSLLSIRRQPSATSSPSSHSVRSFRTVLCFTTARTVLSLVLVQFTYAPYKRVPPWAALCSPFSSKMNIPLHCNICPKRPNFSDVSHLLTHIASKGHLSNYYKVKVRSSHEEASRRIIDAYDRWYAEWGVEELMSERMNQKDKRRTRARPNGMASTPHTVLQTHDHG